MYSLSLFLTDEAGRSFGFLRGQRCHQVGHGVLHLHRGGGENRFLLGLCHLGGHIPIGVGVLHPGAPGLLNGDDPGLGILRRVGTVKLSILVLSEQNAVGNAGGVEHDPLRVLLQQVNEDRFVGLTPGEAVMAHGHLPIGEVVGQAPAGQPECLPAAGLGDLGPVLIAVEHGGPSEHHGGGGQGAGPSLLLLEEHLILVDLFQGGRHGRWNHRRQHQNRQYHAQNPLPHPISPLYPRAFSNRPPCCHL